MDAQGAGWGQLDEGAPGRRLIQGMCSRPLGVGTALLREEERRLASTAVSRAVRSVRDCMRGEGMPSQMPTEEERPVARSWSPRVAQGQLLAWDMLWGVVASGGDW